MSLFDFDVLAFVYDLCLLAFAVWAAGTAILATVRYFIETIVPGYDPTGYKQEMRDYLQQKMIQERKE
jgi:hypothetical protein